MKRIWVEYWPGVVPTDRIRTDSGAVDAAGATTLTDSDKEWDASVWVGGTVWITGGTGSGQVRSVTANTATVVTVAQPWDTTPDVDSEYQIEGPNTGRYRDDGYIHVYCHRPHDGCVPDVRWGRFWILDCNLESTRGGSPGNSPDAWSPNNGDGSVRDRAPYDYSDDGHPLPVAYNDDDDDEDSLETPDREQSGSVTDEDDLEPLRFQFTEGIVQLRGDSTEADKGKVRVRVKGRAPEGAGEELVRHPLLRIWKTETKGEQIVLDTWIPVEGQGLGWYQKEYDLSTDWETFASDLLDPVNRDKTLYVEGYEPSSDPHDAVIELEYELAGKTATDTVRYIVIIVDLDVDADRDGGFPERYEDEWREDSFSRARGAVVLTNSNSDRTDSTDMDHQNDEIDGPPDFSDTSHVVLRRPGLPSIPSGLRAVLRMPTPQTTHFRVFDNRAEGEDEFLGPAEGTDDGSGRRFSVMPSEWVASPQHQSTWTFGIESIDYLGQQDTEGEAQVELVYQIARHGGWEDWSSDRAQLQVAPCVFTWNGQSAVAVYANHHLVDGVRSALAGTSILVEEAGGSNIWVQDYAEFVNTSRRGSPDSDWLLRTIVDLKKVEEFKVVSWPEDLRKAESLFGYIQVDNGGHGGGIMATPPLSNYPVGRLVLSTGGHTPAFRAFAQAQKVQVTDTGGYIEVDTGWLDTPMHADEVICFVPKSGGYAVMVPSPKRAVNIMHVQFVAGNGDAKWTKMGVAGEDPEENKTIQDKLVKTTGGVVQATTLATAVGAGATTFTLSSARFATGDVLRIDDEYVTVTAGGGTTTITVLRAQLGSSAAGHAANTTIYAVTDFVIHNIWKRNQYDGPQRIIDGIVQTLKTDLGNLTLDVRHLPVLYEPVRVDTWTPCTPNLVLAAVAGGKVITSQTYGPSKGGTNYFEQDVVTEFAGLAVTPVFIDAWDMHAEAGGVDCGVNVVRDPLDYVDWWEAWPE